MILLLQGWLDLTPLNIISCTQPTYLVHVRLLGQLRYSTVKAVESLDFRNHSLSGNNLEVNLRISLDVLGDH
ncbi:MAG: hypothetical protein HRT83_02955 [Hyphomicrobiaceae bacterium]|nr:hypothetical protein [Hyphomicrobiaceae bacterium]